MTSLDYALRKTHFDGLELIPANLRLFQSEYEIAARMARGQGGLIDRLSQGISSIADRFDVIVLDPPPALGAISLSVLRAANALVVPVPPTRSEEHTSELQSLMRISYAVFCLKKKIQRKK